MRKLIGLATALAFVSLVPAYAEDAKPFLDQTVIDLTQILPPPPANDSLQTKQELAQVLTVQVTRTPEMVARAQADDAEEVWRFADAVGPKFDKAMLPKTAALFERIAATEGAVVDPAKKIFNRPRPYMLSDLVQPVIEKSKSGAYPSGHTTVGMMMGIVLSGMVPERRDVIMTRAREFGENRVVAGMHLPLDIEEGRVAGSVIAATMMKDPEFKMEYEAAKSELRSALGLSS